MLLISLLSDFIQFSNNEISFSFNNFPNIFLIAFCSLFISKFPNNLIVSINLLTSFFSGLNLIFKIVELYFFIFSFIIFISFILFYILINSLINIFNL